MTPASSTLREFLSRTEARLERAGVDSPRLSAQLVAAHGLGLAREDLLLCRDRALDPSELAALEALAVRREAGEPAAYILGRREFYGLDFEVGPAVLIPRPETEHVVELALERFPKGSPVRFADLGTGSGCLAVTLALLLEARGVGVDLSRDALAVARRNAQAHHVADRVAFTRADFVRLPVAPGSLDLVAANPPYVSLAEWQGLSPEITRWEPRQALVCGETGLEGPAAVAASARNALRPGGLLLMEMGSGQGEAVRGILEREGWRDVRIVKDLSGHDRVAEARN